MKGTRDHRQEPDEPGGSSENYRVDRVFAPARRESPLPARRPTPPTAPPATQPAGEPSETELSLRRQLSRLQHQLAEAQRELAHKDDELAASVEKRMELSAAYEEAVAQLREVQDQIHEVAEYRARTGGIEQRLQTAVAATHELTHLLERERAERAALAAQFEEANASFERARALWKDESGLVEQQHAAEIDQIEQQRRTAIEGAETAMAATLERQKEAHQAELENLRAAHVRELATLRGELEPKETEARNLSAEIERLTSEIAALRAEQLRDLAERIELHKWELAQLQETHGAELAAQSRTHATELSKVSDELDAKKEALQQVERNAELREQLWEQTVGALRESQKKLQQELTEAKERSAQSDASKWAVEQRLVTTLQELEKLSAEARLMRDQLQSVESQSRRDALDRQRFAAYLREGLAMLGELPPIPEPPEDPEVTIEAQDVADAPVDDRDDNEPTRDHSGDLLTSAIDERDPPTKTEHTRATLVMGAVAAEPPELPPSED